MCVKSYKFSFLSSSWKLVTTGKSDRIGSRNISGNVIDSNFLRLLFCKRNETFFFYCEIWKEYGLIKLNLHIFRISSFSLIIKYFSNIILNFKIVHFQYLLLVGISSLFSDLLNSYEMMNFLIYPISVLFLFTFLFFNLILWPLN